MEEVFIVSLRILQIDGKRGSSDVESVVDQFLDSGHTECDVLG